MWGKYSFCPKHTLISRFENKGAVSFGHMLIDKPSNYRTSALHTLNRFFPQSNLIERLLLVVKEHLSSSLSLLEPSVTERRCSGLSLPKKNHWMYFGALFAARGLMWQAKKLRCLNQGRHLLLFYKADHWQKTTIILSVHAFLECSSC